MKSNKASLSNSLSAVDLLAERLTSNSRASSASSLAFDTDASDAQSQQQLASSKVIQSTGRLHAVHPAGTRCSAKFFRMNADLQCGLSMLHACRRASAGRPSVCAQCQHLC